MRTPPRRPTPERTPYTPTPGIMAILSDDPPVTLALLTRCGFKRQATAEPGEAYRCKHPDGNIAVVLDEDRVTITVPEWRPPWTGGDC